MKFFALLFFVGLAAASGRSEWKWESGKEYVYGYQGRLLTGVPELDANHFSGLSINCTVHLQVRESETFVLSIRDPRYVKVDQRLERGSEEGVSAENWRELRIPESRNPISEELVSVLSRPIVFTVSEGEIRSAKVGRDEPVWAVNFKKALALQLQTKLAPREIEENRLVQNSDDEETYWKVKEESIDGVCENTYQVRELPKYMIVENPDLVPHPEACSEEKYFGVTKTRDVAKCEKRSAFTYFKPGQYGSELSGNNRDMWSRSSSTRYIACGSRNGKLLIQSIINDGELNQDLVGVKAEKFVTGTLQVWQLKKVQDIQNETPIPSDLIPVRSMMYEYLPGFLQEQSNSLRNNLNQEERVKLIQAGQIPKNVANQQQTPRQALPRNFLSGWTKDQEIPVEQIKSQVKNLIKEVMNELIQSNDVHEKQIPMKVLSAARGLSLFKTKEQIQNVYSELKSEFQGSEQDLVSMKNIFFDTILMSGTPQSIHFLKEIILSEEMNKVQISNIFIWMSHYIMIPNQEVLKELFELVTSEKVRECPLLYNAAIMGYSTLLEKACISNLRKTSYPVSVFGEFCHPDSEIITEKWIPYLLKDLKNAQTTHAKKNEIIVSLGLMNHKSIIGELIPYIEGSAQDTTKLNRLMAIYSLANLAREQQHIALPIFHAVLSNPAENTEIRIAAFNILIRMNPSMSVMHKIVSLTWTEKNKEILKVINVALATLSRESRNEESAESTMTIAKKASLVYPLIKKTEGVLPSSATIFSGEHLRKLGVGYEGVTSWVASNSSFFPRSFYTEMTYFLEQLRFTPIAFGFRFEGVKSLYKELEELLAPKERENIWQGGEDQINNIKQQLHKEWIKVVDELGLKERKNGPMNGAFFLRLFESSPMFFNFDQVTTKMMKEKIAPLMNNPMSIKDKICGSFPLNFQRTLDMTPNEFLIPSDMGFPIAVEFHMPVALSVRGSVDVDCSVFIPSVSVKAKAVYSSQLVGWVGTINPFDNEYVVTGIDQHTVINLPTEISMKLDVLSSKLSLNLKPVPNSSNKPVTFVHFHLRPFTVSKKVSDLTPLTLQDNIKYIRSNEEVKKVEATFGEYLGLTLKSIVHTESRYTDVQSVFQILRLYNYNPLNMLRFAKVSPALTETGKPSFRKHEYCLTIDPSSSATKEIQVDFKLGLGKKEQQKQQQFNNFQDQEQQHQDIQYQTIKVKSDRSENRLQNPYEVKSVDIESSQVHPRRQQKIKSLLENLKVESGHAFALVCSTTLKGSRPRTWTYTLSGVTGHQSQQHQKSGFSKQKWDLHFESDSATSNPLKHICVQGEVDLPRLPVWSLDEIRSSLIDFRYINTLGYGVSSCSESSIRVTGNARVSHQQKEHSRQSKDAQQCQKLVEENAPSAKLSEACERTRRQAKTIDEVEFKIDYNNVAEHVKRVERQITQLIKVALLPYVKYEKKALPHEESERVLCRIQFNRETPSFDLTINGQQERIEFSKIRIPAPLDQVLPMKAGENNVYLAAKKVVGDSVSPVCKVEETSLTTYENRTWAFHIDYCFHLLSGDCSSERKFGIMTRTMKPGNRRELRVFLGNLMMTMTPSTRQRTTDAFAEIKVFVESEELRIPANTWTQITYKGQDYGSIFRSSDNVFQVKSPAFSSNFLFDGSTIKIYGSQDLKSELCGLCGNFNQHNSERLTGPGQCIYSKPELQIASFRTSSGHECQTNLPRQVQNQLEREREQCVKFEEVPTKITKSLKAQTGQCRVLKHVVVQRQGQVCISKTPVPECGPTCTIVGGETVSKNVSFTCLPEGRLADLYKQKANSGQEMPELRSMPVAFESKVEQPRKCASTLKKTNNNL